MGTKKKMSACLIAHFADRHGGMVPFPSSCLPVLTTTEIMVMVVVVLAMMAVMMPRFAFGYYSRDACLVGWCQQSPGIAQGKRLMTSTTVRNTIRTPNKICTG